MMRWRPISADTDPIIRQSRAKLGSHLGKIETLGDGSVVAIWHKQVTGEPIRWMLLPHPDANQ
jgi:hypothetical protein